MVKRFLTMGTLACLAAAVAVAATAGGASAHQRKPTAKHVLLISVDGLHQSDLAWYVRAPALGARQARAQGHRVHAGQDAVPV